MRAQRSMSTRWAPWTRIRSVPSGTLIIRAMAPTTPTSYRSSGPGCSFSGSREATMTSIRLPARASLTSWMLRSWPMASGVSVSGSGTVSRSGRTGSAEGRRRALRSTSRAWPPPSLSTSIIGRPRARRAARATSIGTDSARAARAAAAAARCAGCRPGRSRARGSPTTSAPSAMTRRNGPKPISSCWYMRPSASTGRRWPAITSSRPSISRLSSSGSIPASSACTTARGGSPS